MSVLTWIEQRTGLVSQTTEFLTEDVPGGASYWYAFGSATLFAMILQIVTGIFLTFYYAPSTASAWESTNYIYHSVPLGWFVISLHFWGATAMIALLLMHMLQVLLWGAYKAPREMSWIVGVLLLVVTLVLGLTGYLLPWDMNAYFASQVAINIASSVPIVGTVTQQFLSGGPGMGTLTINRFFGLHVWLMPALLVLLVGAHLTIFRHNGGAGPPVDHDLKRLPQGRFWPNQMFMDAFLSFAVFVIIVLLSIFLPAGLDAKADPTVKFIAYPAWYFLALYGMLRIAGLTPAAVTPWANLFATVIIPGGFVTLLILLPFLDRNPSRQLTRRPWILGLTAVSLVFAIGLSLYSQLAVQKEQAEAAAGGPPAAAAAARNALGGAHSIGNSSTVGKSTTGGTTGGAPRTAPGVTKGQQIFAQNCASCHSANGKGQAGVFPPLAGNKEVTGDPHFIIGVLLNGLKNHKIEGKDYSAQMPAWKGQLTNADIAAVITYIRTSWGNKASPVSEAQVSAAAK
ncbi:MAG: cytochrome b N-terminal domain-containing protein [Candidatus Eremiobacteraeota bacterium]|nr:cytochrome b N-terminal domain-containing protein [Candidatus Eremiobacteraeota bacterium]MBC5802144.1 cytochrome b N-terminal domain-containing protein [Candidatus Eremiobacteraeota bacterium]